MILREPGEPLPEENIPGTFIPRLAKSLRQVLKPDFIPRIAFKKNFVFSELAGQKHPSQSELFAGALIFYYPSYDFPAVRKLAYFEIIFYPGRSGGARLTGCPDSCPRMVTNSGNHLDVVVGGILLADLIPPNPCVLVYDVEFANFADIMIRVFDS
jgi:hypothetical protein